MKYKSAILAVAGWFGAAAFLLISNTAQAQNLFVSDMEGGNIYEITPSGTISTFATGLNHPSGLAFNSAGDLFEADLSGNIFEFTPDGTQSTFVSVNGNALAFDSTGDLFTSNAGSGDVYKITPDGGQSILASLVNPVGLAFDNAGNLFVADLIGSIYKFTPGGVQSTFASGLDQPHALAFDSKGDLFVGKLPDSIIEITPNGAQNTFASGLNAPSGLAFDGAGNLFEADTASGNIYEFMNTNGVLDSTPVLFASSLGQPFGLAFQGQTLPVPPITLGFSSVSPLTTNGFALSLSGPIGNYVIEASSDITSTNWQPIVSYAATNSPFSFHFTDSAATNYQYRFYRAVLTP